MSGRRIVSVHDGRYQRLDLAKLYLRHPVLALSFCPFSAVLFFAMLIPLALGAGDPVIVPAVFALATGLPAMIVSVLLVKGSSGIVKRVQDADRWIRRVVGVVFILVGAYYLALIYGGAFF